MTISASNEVKRKAASIVLDRLGSDMMELVKYQLRKSYSISLDPAEKSEFSLDRLHFVLSVLIGKGGANNLLRQIVDEIEKIKSVQTEVA